ncbi:valyl-tRNA synthetase [Campylobacter hominis]|uniref:Valyl-tRNA synthetase n=1 Tax=Campylobacter hominis (strain ATCC BAA-381 / DSM 21671 / CCUG 45161 / LMG 19568 / NCTC 13146 / CH001A) TaxID=360107 RepID=A7I1S1_CAMHC|nr:valyl-tRNA synthetase [Campylobacter hominis ATCC BAA-381]SUW84998.1 valyl-tRNA synthetase [Campylobacter hominis]
MDDVLQNLIRKKILMLYSLKKVKILQNFNDKKLKFIKNLRYFQNFKYKKIENIFIKSRNFTKKHILIIKFYKLIFRKLKNNSAFYTIFSAKIFNAAEKIFFLNKTVTNKYLKFIKITVILQQKQRNSSLYKH